MTDQRELEISQVFVSLASSLARGVDVLDMLSGLATDCARLLDVSSAGLLLADARGVLHVVAASSEQARNLEVFQLQRDQGPCLDCYRAGRQVSVQNLPDEAERWPQFAEAAINAGFVSVHALPMHLRDRMLGTLGLFGARTGALNELDLSLGQAFADVASVALVQGAALSEQETLNRQLQGALDSRVIVEQAKGILAQVGDLDMEAAFSFLRRYSRDHNRRLSEVAGALVDREISARAVVEHARRKLEKASQSTGSPDRRRA
jgi:transcriptional regulator with GAF, ATPase, and Fis domain